VIGSAVHKSARSEVTDVAGVPGTTWKKKSRHGSPEVTNVGDQFSVRVFAGGGLVGLLKVGAAAATRAVAAQSLSDGGPRRVNDTARRHAAAAMVWRLGFGAWVLVLVVLLSEMMGKEKKQSRWFRNDPGRGKGLWSKLLVACITYLISNEKSRKGNVYHFQALPF
jgi:hypothetical protein